MWGSLWRPPKCTWEVAGEWPAGHLPATPGNMCCLPSSPPRNITFTNTHTDTHPPSTGLNTLKLNSAVNITTHNGTVTVLACLIQPQCFGQCSDPHIVSHVFRAGPEGGPISRSNKPSSQCRLVVRAAVTIVVGALQHSSNLLLLFVRQAPKIHLCGRVDRRTCVFV